MVRKMEKLLDFFRNNFFHRLTRRRSYPYYTKIHKVIAHNIYQTKTVFEKPRILFKKI